MSATSVRRRRGAPRARKRARPREQRPGTHLFGLITPNTKIKSREVVAFSRELSTLIESGIPVVPSLILMAEQRAGSPFQAVINALIEDLGAGSPLAEAMARHPKVFSRFYVRTIATSDRGADVVASLRQAAEFMDAADSALAQAKKALIYPAIVMVLGISVTILMLTVALPPMIGLFQSLDSELPLPTRVLIALSGFLTTYPLHIGVGTLLTGVGIFQYLKSARGRRHWHRFVLHVPLMSQIIIQNDMARISWAAHSLVAAGLSLPEAIEVAEETVSNEVIRSAIHGVHAQLLAGEGLAGPMAATGLFPTTFTQALRIGEDTGTLDANLKRMADFYRREASETVKTFVGLLEPLSTVVIAMLVGFIAMAVIMPMYSALSTIES
jgi:type IV pilus assembly protein PilC